MYLMEAECSVTLVASGSWIRRGRSRSVIRSPTRRRPYTGTSPRKWLSRNGRDAQVTKWQAAGLLATPMRMTAIGPGR
jgi:hypothetical protein